MKITKSKLPRWMHGVYAMFFGYYWFPCPICGKMFGGHEPSGTIWENTGSGEACCINCAKEGERLSKINLGVK